MGVAQEPLGVVLAANRLAKSSEMHISLRNTACGLYSFSIVLDADVRVRTVSALTGRDAG